MKTVNFRHLKGLRMKTLLDSKKFIGLVSYSDFNSAELHEFKKALRALSLEVNFLPNKPLKKVLESTLHKKIANGFQGKMFIIHSSVCQVESKKGFMALLANYPQLIFLGSLEDGKTFQTSAMVKKMISLPSLVESQSFLFHQLRSPSMECSQLMTQSFNRLYDILRRDPKNDPSSISSEC